MRVFSPKSPTCPSDDTNATIPPTPPNDFLLGSEDLKDYMVSILASRQGQACRSPTWCEQIGYGPRYPNQHVTCDA